MGLILGLGRNLEVSGIQTLSHSSEAKRDVTQAQEAFAVSPTEEINGLRWMPLRGN